MVGVLLPRPRFELVLLTLLVVLEDLVRLHGHENRVSTHVKREETVSDSPARLASLATVSGATHLLYVVGDAEARLRDTLGRGSHGESGFEVERRRETGRWRSGKSHSVFLAV